MMVPRSPLRFLSIPLSLVLGMIPPAVLAQAIPGPADAGRIKPEDKLPTVDRPLGRQANVPPAIPAMEVPEAVRSTHLVLRGVRIEGGTAFTPEELRDIYAPYLGKDVTFATAYLMAGMITERYRNAGYFLSLAYVPDQRVKDGVVTLRVVEGYAGEVAVPGSLRDHAVVREYIDEQKSAEHAEDPGASELPAAAERPAGRFRQRHALGPEGRRRRAVPLTLEPAEKKD